MRKKIVLLTAWPLFCGLAFIMMGNGLQGTLLGLRASHEDFGSFSIGIIMSMYYVGFLGGSVTVPRWIENVGHIRVFTALTAMASVTILTHGVLINPTLWVIIRIITGFSLSGLFVVIESWINSLANKKTRGTILATYNIVSFSALASGQLLLYVFSPETIVPFVIVSILVSMAAIPVALSRKPAPKFEQPESLKIIELWHMSPLSFYTVMVSGFCVGAVYAIAPVYAVNVGMQTEEIAVFMTLFVIGGIVGQLPIGMISDRIGRRATIIAVGIFATVLSVLCYLSPIYNFPIDIFFFLLGSFALSVYALGSSLAIDRLRPEQYVPAAGALLIINGSSAVIGPMIVSIFMTIDPGYFFVVLAVTYISMSLFGIYRSTQREGVSEEDREQFVAVSPATVSTQVATQVVAESQKK